MRLLISEDIIQVLNIIDVFVSNYNIYAMLQNTHSFDDCYVVFRNVSCEMLKKTNIRTIFSYFNIKCFSKTCFSK